MIFPHFWRVILVNPLTVDFCVKMIFCVRVVDAVNVKVASVGDGGGGRLR